MALSPSPEARKSPPALASTSLKLMTILALSIQVPLWTCFDVEFPLGLVVPNAG